MAGVFKLTNDGRGRSRFDGDVLRRVCGGVAVGSARNFLAVGTLPILVVGRNPEGVFRVFPQVGQVILKGNPNLHLLVLRVIPLRKGILLYRSTHGLMLELEAFQRELDYVERLSSLFQAGTQPVEV